MYAVVCDRVGAQALREDVTGASFHAVCHPDATGAFQDKVDQSKLVALDPNATDADGKPVPLDVQTTLRAHRVARIEALARRRKDLIDAFDAAFPDDSIAVMDLGNPDPKQSCQAPAASGEGRLRDELKTAVGKMTDLYNDRTIPQLTEAMASVNERLKRSQDAQNALARLDAHEGYRPADISLGAARPTLSYPHLADLANALLDVLSKSDGGAHDQFEALLTTAHEELRTSVADPPLATLTIGKDTTDPTLTVLGRPRTDVEVARQIFLATDPAFKVRDPKFIVARDPRGVAAVPLVAGKMPAPFVDLTGPNAAPDGLPDLDALGRFVTTDGSTAPTPFVAPGIAPGSMQRDSLGRPLSTAPNATLYSYVDVNSSFAAAFARDITPLLDPDPTHQKEAVLDVLAGLDVIAGERSNQVKTYAPDPDAEAVWSATTPSTSPPPPGLSTSPVTISYSGFMADKSPLLDLVYAVGQVIGDPAADDMLALLSQLASDHPQIFARLVGMGFELRAISQKYPDAQIPANSTLWDELIDVFAQMADKPGLFEDLVGAFGTDDTLNLRSVFAAYIKYKDELTYDRDNLNGPAMNLATMTAGAPPQVPVDRSMPDSGSNRSEFQRFLQMLHDANGLAACTKEGAIAHVVWNGLALDYPTDFTAQAACLTLTGDLPPTTLHQCGILRFDNVAAMLLDVALGRAKFDIRDKCLGALVASPLTGIVGGADAFLETISGIKGFSLHPTVNGVARMTFFDAAHDGMPGDTKNAPTNKFLRDLLDPTPSPLCPIVPFTDSDGTVLNLRKCATFSDSLRSRDLDALFPLEEMGFIQHIGPLAAAFADHGGNLLFVQLFDTLHMHWGSNKQTASECTTTGTKATNPNWCSQDGGVSYEPMLAEILEKSDLFPALHDAVPVIKGMTVQHCLTRDAKTLACTKSETRSGVTVLANATRGLLSPTLNKGLTDRAGNVTNKRNDGTLTPQVLPIHLLIDSLKGFDGAFASLPSSDPRWANWKRARSQFTDALFTVNGTGTSAAFAEPAIPKIAPVLVDALRAQRFAHCNAPDWPCAWAKKELPDKATATVSGPTFARALDLAQAITADPKARAELERLLQYILSSGDSDAATATLAAMDDLTQALDNDQDLVPLLHAFADAAEPARVDDQKNIVRRGMADALVNMLARIFERQYDPDGTEICAKEIDPERTMIKVLNQLVTPLPDGRPAPLTTIIDVIADVNRAHPESTDKLDGGDYASIATEVSDFCTNKSRGLEQMYEIVREATVP
jgi:hypothetical protein